jgi:hypothetical protein
MWGEGGGVKVSNDVAARLPNVFSAYTGLPMGTDKVEIGHGQLGPEFPDFLVTDVNFANTLVTDVNDNKCRRWQSVHKAQGGCKDFSFFSVQRKLKKK